MMQTLSLPLEGVRPAWRAAVLAYRHELQAARDRLAWPAAYAAFREAVPEMPEEQAKQEASQAIAYAAANHGEWFWAPTTCKAGRRPTPVVGCLGKGTLGMLRR
jgi:hypothetical protein